MIAERLYALMPASMTGWFCGSCSAHTWMRLREPAAGPAVPSTAPQPEVANNPAAAMTHTTPLASLACRMTRSSRPVACLLIGSFPEVDAFVARHFRATVAT
jgi:hypothetical protein